MERNPEEALVDRDTPPSENGELPVVEVIMTEPFPNLKFDRVFVLSLLGVLTTSLLFIGAGTVRWWAAWIFIGVVVIFKLGVCLWLYKVNPSLLNRRLSHPRWGELSGRELVFMGGTFVTMAIWELFMGLDSQRYHLTPPLPLIVPLIGYIMFLLSATLMVNVMMINPFASAQVEVLPDHVLVDTGVYAYIRHPLYLAALLGWSSMPLILGALYSLAFVVLLIMFVLLRIFTEEIVLLEHLEGYRDYYDRVHYRLIPYVF